MPFPPLVNGKLPLGRWPATIDEIESTFVASLSDRRQKIWKDWLDLTEAVRDAVTAVPAAWIGGSFLTGKDEPKDIDCVYVIEISAVLGARVDPERAAFLQAVATKGEVERIFGLSVDSFILEWQPRAGTTRPLWSKQYLEDRGYWDDLWSRERSAEAREDSLPRRGYLEVILDGYS
jgi:hypothetical protein